MSTAGGYDVIHQLSGENLGERRESLNRLVNFADSDVLAAGAARDWARSSQSHQIYIARLADRFRNGAVLCELLRSENEMVVSVATSAAWFFRGLTDGDLCNARYFITRIFPYASYRSICRIISAFSVNLQNESIAEEFYTQISATFGNNMAIRLLPVCSVDFIRTEIMKDNFEVPSIQLVYIYKKDQKLALDFLTKYLKKEQNDKMPRNYDFKRNYSKVWSLVAQDHLDIVLELFVKYPDDMNIKLGSQTTRNAMKIILDKIVDNPSKYMEILHVQTLIRKCKLIDLEILFSNLLPAKEKDFYFYDINHILKYLNPAFQLTLLSKVYTKKYKTSLWEKDQFTDWNLAQYLPLEVRTSWALKRIKNLKSTDHVREDFFLKYLPAEKAIPRLQALIFTSPESDRRTDILNAMVDCCKINDDVDSLLKVLQYTASRHRNEQASLRLNFLRHLNYSYKLHLLSSEHWEVINEMLDFIILSEEIEKFHWNNICDDFFEKYIHHRLLNNLEIDSVVDKMIENKVSNIVLLEEKPEYQDRIIQAFFFKFKKIIEENPKAESVETHLSTLLKSYYYRVNREISLMDCTWLLNVLRKFKMNPKQSETGQLLYYCVGDIRVRNAFTDEILENYFHQNKIRTNYLKHNASALIRNMGVLIEPYLTNKPIGRLVRLLKQIRAYLMNPFGEELKDSLCKIIESGNPKNKGKVIMCLCLLTDVEESEKLLKQYVPKDTKVDIKHIHTYKIAEAIGKNLKHVNPPVSFELLQKFLEGDFLKYSLESLMSLCFKKSMKNSERFLLELSTKAISVRKHSVRLSYFLYPREALLQLYKDMWGTARNSSIRDVLFQRTFKMYQTERDYKKRSEIWSVIKCFMESFEAIDKNLFSYLTMPGNIYPELIPDYIETSWKILETWSNGKIDVDNHILSLTDELPNFIELLNEDFSESIIAKCLISFGEKSVISESLLTLLVNCIVKAKDIETQEKYFENTKDIMMKFIEEKWNIKEKNCFPYRISVERFVSQCCSESLYLELRVNPVSLLKSVIEMLSSSLPFGAVFKLHIMLNLTINLIELSQKPHTQDSQIARRLIEELGLSLAAYLNLLCDQYGVHILPIFIESYACFISNLPSRAEMNDVFNEVIRLFRADISEAAILNLIKGLLEGEATEQSVLMAVKLFPEPLSPDCEYRALYEELLETVRAKSTPSVLVNLNSKIPLDSNIF